MYRLKPCPYCGAKKPAVKLLTGTDIAIVLCGIPDGGCGAVARAGATAEEAVEAWNTRASGWIPCSERTPENAGADVIVYAKNRYGQDAEFIAFQGYGDFKWHTMDTRYMDHTQPGEEVSKAWEITHWRLLPEPPEKEDENA